MSTKRETARAKFARQMFEGAAHHASIAKSPLEAVFALGKAWSWAEVSEEESEDNALYQRRINAIVLKLHELGMKPLPAELPRNEKHTRNNELGTRQVANLQKR